MSKHIRRFKPGAWQRRIGIAISIIALLAMVLFTLLPFLNAKY